MSDASCFRALILELEKASLDLETVWAGTEYLGRTLPFIFFRSWCCAPHVRAKTFPCPFADRKCQHLGWA